MPQLDGIFLSALRAMFVQLHANNGILLPRIGAVGGRPIRIEPHFRNDHLPLVGRDVGFDEFFDLGDVLLGRIEPVVAKGSGHTS